MRYRDIRVINTKLWIRATANSRLIRMDRIRLEEAKEKMLWFSIKLRRVINR